jgi:diguanylate cyclase (GGDEF)-like protein/PAS domain S-box-containing protein
MESPSRESPSPLDGLLDPAIARLALREASDVVAVVDAAGAVLSSNAEASGKPGAPLAAGGWQEFWERWGRDQARDALQQAAESGRRCIVRCRSLASGKRPRFWDCTVLPVAAGAPGRLLVVARDVTDAQETSRALSKTARLHSALIEATSEIVWHYDVAAGTTDRRGWFEFTGAVDDAADFNDWLRFLHPDDRGAADGATDDAVAAHRSLTVRYRLRHKSGEWRWMEDHAVPLADADGTVTDWVGIVSDIHDQWMAAEALRKSEERLRLAVEATGLGTWDWDLGTGERQWSVEVFGILGLPPASALPPEAFLARVQGADRAAAAAIFDASSPDDGASPLTFRLGKEAGAAAGRWVEMRRRAYRGADGRPIRQVGTMQDVTERKLAEARIWTAAFTDDLTGIPNRSLFHERLNGVIARGGGAGGASGLIVVDLDSFKEVNDSLGHDAGDAVLREVARRLTAAVPPGVTVARLGGDEFGVIVPGRSGAALAAAAARLVAALKPPLRRHGRDLPCAASVGFTRLSGSDAATALKHADIAMYAAKSAGGAQALAYHPDMSARLARRLRALGQAREALGRDAVVPFYQPKVSLETGLVEGFEALLRWSDGRRLRGPAEMAEALADPELAVLLGGRMLERAVEDMRAWKAAGLSFGHVALNATAPELADEAFTRRVLAAVGRAGLDPGHLEIEVTETVFLGDGAAAVGASLERLHEAGVSLALDDFGTGFASLTHLRKFPVSCLKIDYSFISDLEGEPSSAAIVEAVVELAHRLAMRVVAEGLETSGQAAFLSRIRCDSAQGFLFAKPMAASRVPHFLRTWQPFGAAGAAAPDLVRRA